MKTYKLFSRPARQIGAGLALSAALFATGIQQASAFEWADTYFGYRTGTQYREPFDTQKIGKNIFSLTHADGYKYGTNFFNVDMLQSDSADPAAGGGGGATEVFVVYRHELSIGKVTGWKTAYGPIADMGITAGFDFNSKNDAFGARVHRPMVGPTINWAVPKGFFSTSLMYRMENNHNGSAVCHQPQRALQADLESG